MDLRDSGIRVGGKVVGRVGVEPTTKRLRATSPNQQSAENSAESPLNEVLVSPRKQPPFQMALRGILHGLLIVFVLTTLIVGAIVCWSTPEDQVPAIDRCPPHEAGNPWCYNR